jgi:hypothetical protein
MSVPQDLSAVTVTTNVTVTTTSETIAVTSAPVTLNYQTALIFIMAWCQLTTGTATADVTPRIRQGSLVTGTLVGEANAVTVGAAAGSTEQFLMMAAEERFGENTVVYNLTVQQGSATGNGTILQASILVIAR